jgi:hypothetical protein
MNTVMNLRTHKRRGNSWRTEYMSAFTEWLCCVEVMYFWSVRWFEVPCDVNVYRFTFLPSLGRSLCCYIPLGLNVRRHSIAHVTPDASRKPVLAFHQELLVKWQLQLCDCNSSYFTRDGTWGGGGLMSPCSRIRVNLASRTIHPSSVPLEPNRSNVR